MMEDLLDTLTVERLLTGAMREKLRRHSNLVVGLSSSLAADV